MPTSTVAAAAPIPRQELVMEEICRSFCEEQDKRLREVAAVLRHAALQAAEQRLRESSHPRRSGKKKLEKSTSSSSLSLSALGSGRSTSGTPRAAPALPLQLSQAPAVPVPDNPRSQQQVQQPQEDQRQHQQQQKQQQYPKQLPAQQTTSPSNSSTAPTPSASASICPSLSTHRQQQEVVPSLKTLSFPGAVLNDGATHGTDPWCLCDELLMEELDWVGMNGTDAKDAQVTMRNVSIIPASLDEAPAGNSFTSIPSQREAPADVLGFRDSPSGSSVIPTPRLWRDKTMTSSESKATPMRPMSSRNARLDLLGSVSGLWQSVGSFFGTSVTVSQGDLDQGQGSEAEVDIPKTEAHRKASRRLQTVLGLGSKENEVPRESLVQCMSRRMELPEASATSVVDAFLEELIEIRSKLQSLYSAADASTNWAGSSASLCTQASEGARMAHSSLSESVPLDLLATVVSLPDPAAYSRSNQKKLVLDVTAALLTLTTAETIEEVTKSGAADFAWPVVNKKVGAAWEMKLNMFVAIVICINLASAGISVDHGVGSIWWVYLEIFCALVMVAELLIKIAKLGAVEYFMGGQSYWNWLDCSITMLGVLDMVFTILNHFVETSSVTDGQGLKITVAFRALRIARIVRMVKVISNPLLKDFAKMVVGFIIGLPQLIWVLVMFSGILYLTGLFFRLSFGPNSTAERLSDICPNGDDVDSGSDPACLEHRLYSEEFFSTVQVSMFTCFRFMLGDFGTRGGKNLVVFMSEYYGFMFNGIFGIWMIVVIFGVFNIISAIFVDATITGLKHNEIKKKYVQQYEKRFVREKLTELMGRIRTLCEGSGVNRDINLLRSSSCGVPEDIVLYEAEFIDVMQDPIVKSYLQDLDIVMYNPADLFDTFDPDGAGRVTGPGMVEAFVKLRGEPQKNDLVAAWLSLRGLHEKVDELRLTVAHHAHHMQVRVASNQVWADPMMPGT